MMHGKKKKSCLEQDFLHYRQLAGEQLMSQSCGSHTSLPQLSLQQFSTPWLFFSFLDSAKAKMLPAVIANRAVANANFFIKRNLVLWLIDGDIGEMMHAGR